MQNINRPFLSCFEPHCQNEAKCIDFIMKISFHLNANKTNFHMKSSALSLAFIMRFTATRKWPIVFLCLHVCIMYILNNVIENCLADGMDNVSFLNQFENASFSHLQTLLEFGRLSTCC